MFHFFRSDKTKEKAREKQRTSCRNLAPGMQNEDENSEMVTNKNTNKKKNKGRERPTRQRKWKRAEGKGEKKTVAAVQTSNPAGSIRAREITCRGKTQGWGPFPK